MRRRFIGSTASVVLMSAALVTGCGDGDDPVTGGAGQNATVATTAAVAASTTTSVPASTAGGVDEIDALLPFVDAFNDDSNGWGGPFQRFDDGDYVWELPAGQSDRRSPDTLIAVEDDIEAVEVTTSLSVEGIGAVGVECAYEELEGSARWYRLLLGDDGAEITEQGLGMVAAATLASSPSGRLIDGEIELRVVCRPDPDGYRLELHVNGELVVAATDVDGPFGRAGAPNLYAQAAPAGADAAHTARFHDLTIVDPDTTG